MERLGYALSPMTWTKPWRRAFIILFPVTVPAWLVANMLVLLFVMAMIPFAAAYLLWSEIVRPMWATDDPTNSGDGE